MVLTRPRQAMPAAVRRALEERDLLAAYKARPPYQRNDYLAWIKRAKRPETRGNRLGQMLDELAAGDAYMGMAYDAKPASEWTCPRCGRAFQAKGARHSCVSRSPEALFRDHPQALALHKAVLKVLRSFGPVEAEATRTQAAFRAERRFAYVWVPAMSLRGGSDEVYLTFDLARRVASPRIKESVEARPGVWVHHARMEGPEELDDEVRAWLREAYETRGLKGPGPRTKRGAPTRAP